MDKAYLICKKVYLQCPKVRTALSIRPGQLQVEVKIKDKPEIVTATSVCDKMDKQSLMMNCLSPFDES